MPAKIKLIQAILITISICIGFLFVSSLGLGAGARSFYTNSEQVTVSGRAVFHVGARGTSNYITIDGIGRKIMIA